MAPEQVVLLEEGGGPIVATAIHDGHAMRPELISLLAIDDATRLREEDPFTARLARVAPTHLIATRSRFELDLNRPREAAIYRTPDEAFGLSVWREPLPASAVEKSLAGYDAFYAVIERVLRQRERRSGRFVVLDVHSYNHRRRGVSRSPMDEPEVNVGTGTLDRSRWGALVDRFIGDLSGSVAGGLDVRENVRFFGGELSAWIHRTFPETGCALALEFKKTFMDEWSGELWEDRMAVLERALASTLPGLVESLGP